jgi:restriction system protein
MKTKTKEEVAKYITEHEHIRRLFLEEYPWEGITWIIDLLPNSPNEALKVLDAYFIAHLLFLPDNALYGINDSSTIISAKYIEYEYPQQIFLSLSPIEFEWLIEELFKHKGYETTLTPQSHDGGIDIIAEKKGKNEREKILIQCKRYEKKLTVKEVREFNGVINDYPLQKGEKVTKGILITSADFTNVSLKEFSNNYSIELVNYKTLSKELNRYLGRNWYHRRNNIFRKKIKNANA